MDRKHIYNREWSKTMKKLEGSAKSMEERKAHLFTHTVENIVNS